MILWLPDFILRTLFIFILHSHQTKSQKLNKDKFLIFSNVKWKNTLRKKKKKSKCREVTERAEVHNAATRAFH